MSAGTPVAPDRVDRRPGPAPASPRLPARDPVVSVRSLTKRYGEVVAVDAITFSLEPGTVTGFLGPNGAGKTTTLRLLLGLARPTAGEALVFGRRYRQLERPTERVGAVLESTDFHPGRNGRDHLRTLALAAELPHSRVEEVLELVELTGAANRRAKTYSLGMRQRLGVARCLLCDPELLILDEPMNGLDPAGIQEFRRLIRELVSEGRTVLLSSHLLDEVERTCDVAAIVDRGSVVAQGTIHELVRGGPRAIDIVCHGPAEAAALLAAVPGVMRASHHDSGLRVTLSPEAPVDREIVTALLRRLLDHGMDVERVAPVATTLEDRFLTMTTPLEERD
jgi:ABC-2 type transport system ATP-binding protein